MTTTFTDLHKFEDFVIERGYTVIQHAGIAGYDVAVDYRGRQVARVWTISC